MANSIVKYIGSTWRKTCLTIKILIIAVILFALLQVIEVTSLYINVNSGGLGKISGKIFLYCFLGSGMFSFLLFILLSACFIISLIKLRESANILMTVVAAVIAFASFSGRIYTMCKIQYKPGPDPMRCVSHNVGRADALKKFGLKLNLAKNNKDLVFTPNWNERDFPHSLLLPLKNGKFVLNANLLNKKPSKMTDDTVVIFESNIPHDGANIGGPDDISTWWHYGLGSLMVFGDGRVEFVKTEDFNNLQW